MTKSESMIKSIEDVKVFYEKELKRIEKHIKEQEYWFDDLLKSSRDAQKDLKKKIRNCKALILIYEKEGLENEVETNE